MKTSLFRAITACVFVLALAASNSLLAQPSPFVGQDVGTPGHPGGVTTNINGTMSINGGGDDIWNNADNFFYYYTSVTGVVWEAKMRVVSFTGPDQWSKVQLMARRPDPVGGTPQGADPEYNITVTQASQQNEVRAAWRGVRSAASGDNGGTGLAPTFPNQWVRLTRVGSVFTVYYGNNGVNWTRLGSQDTATTANGFDGTAWENPIEVGVAVTAHNNGDANGATAVVSNLTVALVPPPSSVGVVTQIPSTATTFQYTEASFTFVATNNSNPNGIVGMDYAWYKNNQLVSPNPMGTQYTFLTTPADNGAQIYAVATVQAPYNTLSITSSVATLTVNPPSFIYTNGLKREFFAGANRQDVEIGNVGRATTISKVSGAQLPGGFGDNYADRFSGYFIPPTTAAYVFFVAADDDTDVYLSSDSNPTNKALIAQEPGWSGTLNWFLSGSAGVFDLQQKRSDQWSPDPLTIPAVNPNGFYLAQGNLYYLEVVHHNGVGGDNFAVTYQTTNQIADPNWLNVFNNGTNSLLQASNNNIALVTSPTTTLSWTLQPTNLTVFQGGSASFFSKAVSDSELAVGYQWYTVSPPAPIAGATGPTLVIPNTPFSYNGLQGYCVASAAEGGLSITSSVATLTVVQSVFELGWSFVEWWNVSAPSRPTIEAGGAPPPQQTYATPSFETGVNNESGNNYANRVSGFFIPPATDNYVFFVNSDDDSDLFLSTDNTPGNKRLIAQEAGWSNPFNWNSVGGGSTTGQKRSDQFSPDGGLTTPYSTGIHLNAGQSYYIEAVHHEGGGGDNFEATFKRFTDPDPVNGTDSALAGNVIGFFTPRIPWVAFLQQPSGQSVTSGGNSVTFTASGYSAPSVMPGTTGDPRPLFGLPATNVTYQWLRNGTPISGATASSYTLVPILPSDNNAQFVCGIRALGYADNSLNPIFSNSVPAVLNVITDTVPPTISYAATLQNTNPLTPLFIVNVTFSEWMDATTLTNPANYSIAGVTITKIVLLGNHRTVELQLNQMPTLPLNITINGVKDVSGNTIALNSTAPINPVALTCSDVGSVGLDPAYPTHISATASGGYIISAEGSDIWNTADGFNFTWELKTNDFDVVVRGVNTTHTSQWAKMGLMVRETLDATSRNWNIVNDPRSADGIMAPDGSGLGANTIECNTRQTAGTASGGWGNLAGGSVPAYPNAWVRLKRTANLLEAFRSVNGLSWTRMAAYDTGTNVNGALPSTAYVGLCTTAHNNDQIGLDPTVGPFLYYNTVEYANYTSSYIPPAQLTAVISGANLIVSWVPNVGHLEASPTVSGPWVNIGTVNPATVPIGPGARFFRVVNP